MQSSGFPPLGRSHSRSFLLPHWQRGGAPPDQRATPPEVAAHAAPRPPPPAALVAAEAWKRAATDLERSLKFLQEQHAETLQELHAEIDRLKRQNKDLHYKLIMHPMLQKTTGFPSSTLPGKAQPGSNSKGKAAGNWMAAAAATKEKHAEPKHLVRCEKLEEKPVSGEFIKEEENTEEEESAVGEIDGAMQKELEDLRPEQETLPAEAAPRRDSEVCDRMTSPIPFPSSSQSRAGDVKIPAASSNPFLVTVLPSYMRKPPTLEECEVVIRQLWNINHMQMQELMYLRSCLDDIHKTKRIPEDYMLAGQLGSQEATLLPRVKNGSKKWILTPLPAAERAVLPALKQTLGNAFAERQKRTQAVQRNRLHRTAL
ncbi:coiled-coil domain-containing protein 74B isoform X2 [Rhineura floridana]|uniref:coiled-coil domain-containing protein 74B isoform X2 n=1 Tax=Rhineura floridana TaxID=261503 RepID=UPI002AC893A9|nr:coiled-coil domain-containing protein 74B isoform X2 [Rhineura floridana]